LNAGPTKEAPTDKDITFDNSSTETSIDDLTMVINAGGSMVTLEEVDAFPCDPVVSQPIAGRLLTTGGNSKEEDNKLCLKTELQSLQKIRSQEKRFMNDLLANTKFELMELRKHNETKKLEFENKMRGREVELEILERHFESTKNKMSLQIDNLENKNKEYLKKTSQLEKQLEEQNLKNELLIQSEENNKIIIKNIKDKVLKLEETAKSFISEEFFLEYENRKKMKF